MNKVTKEIDLEWSYRLHKAVKPYVRSKSHKQIMRFDSRPITRLSTKREQLPVKSGQSENVKSFGA